MRLTPPGSDEVSTIEPVRKRLEIYPTLRFKLDPTNDWTRRADRRSWCETGAVDSLDLKGQYKGTPVDVDTDPELYRKLIEAFPDGLARGPGRERRDQADPRSRSPTVSPGTRRSTRSTDIEASPGCRRW